MKLHKKARYALGAVVLASALTACGTSAGTGSVNSAGSSTGTIASTSPTATTAAVSAAVTKSVGTSTTSALAANLKTHDSATEWAAADEVKIALTGKSATADSDAVEVDGGTITISAPDTYRISGALTDGQIVVNSAADGLVRLVLDGADITSSTTSAIAIVNAGEAVVVLADGTANSLADGSDYSAADAAEMATDAEEPSAALFSTADLTITGAGALTVDGNSNDGISSKDGLVLDAGTLSVKAVDDGIRGKDYLVVDDGKITVSAGGDGLKADNATDATAGYIHLAGGTIAITSGSDGVQAKTDTIVTGGKVTIASGGGSNQTLAPDGSAKGLRGDVSVVVGGGTVAVDAADDAVHSDGVASIQGGELTLASADDGVHADTDVTIADGTVSITKAYEGIESAAITVAGGVVTLTTTDDGINVAGGNDSSGQAGGRGGPDSFAALDGFLLTVSGGTLTVNAGGDGLDSNGSAVMSGGTVVVNGRTQQGNGALDVNGTFDVSGGTLTAAGSSGMAVAPTTTSKQAWVSVPFAATQPAGTQVRLVSADGKEVATLTPTKAFQSLVFSSSAIAAGGTYDVYAGSAKVASVTAGQHTGGGRRGF